MFKKYDKVVILFLMVIIIWALLIALMIELYGTEQALAEPIASIEVIEYIPEPPQPEPELQYIGEFTITGYCPCEQCCGKWAGGKTASGTIPQAGRTVGADWGILPAGTAIYIEGMQEYRTVEDKPAEWILERYDGKIIDVYCATHDEAKSIGRQQVKIYKVVK